MNTEIPLHTPSGVYKHGGADEVATATAAANAIVKANASAKLDPNWIASQMSITSDASGLKLSADSTSPGANKVYGTDGSGVKGWKADPAGGGGVSDGDKGDVTVSSSGTVWTVDKQMSITSDASGLKLDGDSASPGALRIYGTDGAGTKGWKTDNSIATATPTATRIPLSNGSAKLDPGWLALQMSVTSDAAGVKLSGDATTPGASQIYGTDSGGTKGWKSDNSIATVTPSTSRIPLSNASAKLDPGWLALQMSVTYDAAGVKLSGDATTPGANQVYGTDSGGTKGWKADTAIGTVTPTASKIPLANASAVLDPGWIPKQMSITSDASGLKLSGDSTGPGNNKVYGTDGSGNKGWSDKTPLTTQGDILTRGASADQRLAVGSRGKSLLSDGTDPVYSYDNLTGTLENLSAVEWVVGATTSTFSTYGDSVSANGTPTASAGDANQPVMINGASGAVAGNAAGWYGSSMTIPRQQPKVVAIIRLVDITSIRIWVSLHDGSSTSGTNADDPASRNLMGFRFSTDAGDTNWRCCTKDGSTLNNQDSGVAPTTSGVTRLMIDHTGSSVKFYINGTLVATSSSNLPSSTAACRLQIYAETRTTAAKNIRAHSAAIVRSF